MEKNSYRDVYAKTLLNEIKNRVRQNRMKLSGEEEKEADIKMLEVIKDLCVKSKSELDGQDEYILKVLPSSSEEETERIICTLMLYYAALYNDNVTLLNELLEKGYNFGHERYRLNLFALDRRISSQFEKSLYFNLLENQSLLFDTFYYSLCSSEVNVPEQESINSFCSILNKDPQVAVIKEKDYFGQKIFYDMLTKKSLFYFGEEVILNSTEEQKRNIITCGSYRLLEDELNRLINLMKFHNFSIDIFYPSFDPYNKILKEFTDEELIKINEYEEDLFRKNYNYQTCEIDFDKIRKVIKQISNQDEENRNVKKKLLNLFRKIK